MRRRRFLAGAAAAGMLATAGCTAAPAPGGNSSGNTDGGDANRLEADLEEQNVQVEMTKKTLGDLYVYYYYRSEKARQDITRIALTYTDYAVNTRKFLAANEIEADGSGIGDLRGNYYIDRQWALDYRDGKLSKDAYVQKVLDSYTES